jgi:hypothetical protein
MLAAAVDCNTRGDSYSVYRVLCPLSDVGCVSLRTASLRIIHPWRQIFSYALRHPGDEFQGLSFMR